MLGKFLVHDFAKAYVNAPTGVLCVVLWGSSEPLTASQANCLPIFIFVWLTSPACPSLLLELFRVPLCRDVLWFADTGSP